PAGRIGTEGFIPPEGPGGREADIFSLGKVLYEMASGRDRLDYPALPADLDQLKDRTAILELSAVIAKACAKNPRRRYSSVSELLKDLARLQRGESVLHHRAVRRGLCIAAITIGALALAGALAAAILYFNPGLLL